MSQANAERIVDAYGWAIELDSMELPSEAKEKVDNICDCLRDYMILLLSDATALRGQDTHTISYPHPIVVPTTTPLTSPWKTTCGTTVTLKEGE